MTYILYLAPANLSGYEVCPMRTKECTNACLHGSGHNKIDTSGRINKSRIAKTKLFFEHREFFMSWLVAEIRSSKAKAERKGMLFSVRLNGTSDIEPRLFKLNGRTVFELFSDVQFYDYTKVFKRMSYAIPNYDLTFSYTGYNMPQCINVLDNGGRISVVFEKDLPGTFMNAPVFDGDVSDLRYLDSSGVVGLRFKKVKNKIDLKNNPFIVSA